MNLFAEKQGMLRIALIALVVRALYLLQSLSSPFFARPLLDQHYYDLCARQLAGGGGDLIDGFRPLLYPLFLSIFYSIDSQAGMILALIAQHLLGIVMVVLIYGVATRAFSSTKAGWIAGLLFAFSPLPLFFEGQLMIPTLISLLLLILWAVIFHTLDRPPRKSIAWWILAGVVLGLAAQARPNALPLLLFFPMLALLRSIKTGRILESCIPLSALVGLVAVQALFGVVNARYSGEFSLVTQAGGINFYLGNSQKADGMHPRQDRHVVYEGAYRDPIQVMAEQGFRETTGMTGSVSQKTVSDFWKNKTLDEIKMNPTQWLGLMAKKTGLMFWNHEVPNNRSFEFAAEQDTPLLRWLPVRWWLLLALFPWGIAALLHQRRTEQILWIGSFLLLYSATIILFFVNSRFRIPLWPGMAIVAGGGALYLWNSLKAKTIRSVPIVFSAILLLFSLVNWFRISADPIEHDHSMRARAYIDQGNYEKALEDIRRCLEIAPGNPRYHFVLGNILLGAGYPADAAAAYSTAIKLNASDPLFHNNLGIAYENMGKFEHARTAYNRALELQPRNKAARTNLMLISIRTDDLEQSRALLMPLLREDPENSILRCANYILLYKETGDAAALAQANSLNLDLAQQMLNTRQ